MPGGIVPPGNSFGRSFMPCYFPIPAWFPNHSDDYLRKYSRDDRDNRLIFSYKSGRCKSPIPDLKVACGSCLGCRLARSAEWAVRLQHEYAVSSFDTEPFFLTLTYDQAHLPSDGSLHYDHVQLFMKNLRDAYPKATLRYYVAGEYGEKFRRPHWHMILYGLPYGEKGRQVRGGTFRLFDHPRIAEIWDRGYISVGGVSFESCAYVARYVTKKVTGDMAQKHYTVYDPVTGEVLQELRPEFSKQSLKPAIGLSWLERHWRDVYPNDYVLLNGHKWPVPRYYDKMLLKNMWLPESEIDAIFARRVERGLERSRTDDQLNAAFQTAQRRFSFQQRNLE